MSYGADLLALPGRRPARIGGELAVDLAQR
jgi:hypothetical protein